MTIKPWTFFMVAIAGWMDRQQQDVIAYLREENRVLREKLGHKRIILNDSQKRRLAAAAMKLGRDLLRRFGALFSPDTILRWQCVRRRLGYPMRAQDRRVSPYGSAQAAAVQRVGQQKVTKFGPVLPPCQEAGHWASGWVGGLQVPPGRRHRWIGLANASPTAPSVEDKAASREEPPPSLAGFAWCDETWPVRGWHWCDQPIEWADRLPAEAVANGEGVNMWRQHLLVLPDGRLALFYNSSPYGQEQLYMQWACL